MRADSIIEAGGCWYTGRKFAAGESMIRSGFACFVLVLLAGVAAPLHAQKDEATLVAAWEQEQKADPATIKFEKLEDRKYHFATKRFPFDGELLIRNIAMQDFGEEGESGGIASGTVEVELQGVSGDFHRTYAMSYGQWTVGNTFYWEAKGQRWLTPEQHTKQFRETFPRSRSLWSILFAQGWLVLLLVLVVVLFLSLFRYNRRMKEITERSNRSVAIGERAVQLSERNVQIQEEHAKLLQEIRDLLKK
jgi:hypothetical protein